MNRFSLKQPIKLRIEQLEQRSMLAASPVELNGIGYFVDPSQASFQRYDIAAEQWLAPIRLVETTSSPSAFHVDSDGIYAAFDRAVYRFDHTGGARQHLLNASTQVIAIHSDANLLFINHSVGLYAKLTSINKVANTVIDSMDSYIDALGGSSIAPSKNRLLGRSIGISPSDLTYVDYNEAGNLLTNGDSPYHGAYVGASKTWVFGDDRYVIDNSGNIYATDSLLHSGRLGTEITDIGFRGGDIPVVLDGNKLTAYSSGFLPTGSFEMTAPGEEIFVNDNHILVFRQSATSPSGYSVEVVALTALNTPTPGTPIDPQGVAYAPDEVFIARDGTVLLFDKQLQSVFRWDPASQKYSQSIRLLGAPDYVAYSEQMNWLYTAYRDGLIRKIDLNAGQLVEEPFFNLPGSPQDIVAADPFLVAEDSTGAWSTLNTISASGKLVDKKDWHYPSIGPIWSKANQELFYFSGYSPSDLHGRKINANGTLPSLSLGGIGVDRDTPLHGDARIQAPVRVSPDGRTAVLGSGAIFDVATLAPSNHALANSAIDFAWLNGKLFSVRNIAGISQVQRWEGTSYAETGIRQFANTASRLLAIRDNVLLLITSDNSGIPVFNLLNASLQDASISGDPRTIPQLVWNPPASMLTLDPLSAIHLSATTEVAGQMTYSPPLGTHLAAGQQQLTVTFIPNDTTRFEKVTKSVAIKVLGVDFGDAPKNSTNAPNKSYPVTLLQDGARHVLSTSLRLGTQVDGELDGRPTDNNGLGDNAQGPDEDGVQFLATILSLPNSSASSLAVSTNGSGYVTAWIDFNGNGQWLDEHEQIVVDKLVSEGTHVFSFEVPPHSPAGTTAARIRLSSQAGLSPTGPAHDGEVEDYQIEIRSTGESMEIVPVGNSPIAILNYSNTEVEYRQDQHVLARYPKSLWTTSYYFHHGHVGDETIEIDAQIQGEIVLLGDARSGVDRIVLNAFQHLDLTQRPKNGIENIEAIDLRGKGMNRLKIDPVSAKLASNGVDPLKIHSDAIDQVFFAGPWNANGLVSIDGNTYHQLSSGDATVYWANDRMQQNPLDPHDVDRNGSVTPLDVLLIINRMNNDQAEGEERSNDLTEYLDVNGDGSVTPLDVLLIINTLNRTSPDGEGESPAFDDATKSNSALDLTWELDRRKRKMVDAVIGDCAW